MKTNSIILSTFMTTALLFMVISPARSAGEDTIAIHTVGHGSLMFEFEDMIIHIDPSSSEADYTQLPDADLIFITHGHGDHYDLAALEEIKKDSTIMVCNQQVKDYNTYTDTAIVMSNGDSMVVDGIPVKAVPAYNPEKAYHPKGVGNGYVLTLGEKNVYIAGDTENIPEMDNLGRIDIAFLPMNEPFTMIPGQAADAAIRINPDILYIYHFGPDTAQLRSLLSDYENIEVRIGESVYYEKTTRDPDEPSGLKKNELYKVDVFPNPVKDNLIIRTKQTGLQLSVFNTTGQLLMRRKLNGHDRQTLDLGFLEPGIYVLLVANKGYNTAEILVKE